MYVYSVDEWVLLFFAYALAGYLWEVVWVSLHQKKLCNRGFLYGPLLPIYGFGAIIILHATLPVADSGVMIFLLGMLSATALELVTGVLMLKIFKVRYWDYSKDIGNVKGYICPKASLAWGMFSLLLVRFVHPFFDGVTHLIPAAWAGIAAHVLALGFAVDVTLSVRNAFDLKAALETLLLDENNNGIPDRLEAIPIHLREKHRIAKKRLHRLLVENPTAVFDRKLNEIAQRVHERR